MKMPFNALRWAAAVLAAGLLTATGLGAEAEQAKPIILKLQWRPQAQFAGYMVAGDKGFFKDAGLPEVRLQWFSEGDPPLKLVADGKADFCTAWLSTAITVRAKGGDIVCVDQLIQKAALMIVARRGAGVTTIQDLTGRRVGLWGGDFDVPHIALFKKFNVHPEIVNQSYSIAPFLRGAVNATSAMYYNEYHKLFEAGLRPADVQTFNFSDYGLNFPEDGLYCSGATRRERAAVCFSIVAASLKGWAYAISHETEALDIIMKYCDDAQLATNRNHQRWMLRAMGELIQHRVGKDPAHWGTLAREDYDNVAKTLKEQGLIETIPAYEEFYRPALGPQEPKP